MSVERDLSSPDQVGQSQESRRVLEEEFFQPVQQPLRLEANSGMLEFLRHGAGVVAAAVVAVIGIAFGVVMVIALHIGGASAADSAVLLRALGMVLLVVIAPLLSVSVIRSILKRFDRSDS